MATASDVMHRPIEWATQVWTLKKVADAMIRNAYSQLPVRDGEQNVGRVTEDMLCLLLEDKPAREVARSLVRDMPKPGRAFRVVPPDTDEERVLKILEQEQAILVGREGQQRLQDWGIITRADFVDRLR